MKKKFLLDMFNQQKQESYFISHHAPSEVGLTKEKFSALEKEEREPIDTTISNHCLKVKEQLNGNQKKSEEKFVIVESLPETKLTTSIDKNNISEKDIQHTNSLLTLDQVLTSRGKDLEPFWNMHTMENSRNLWLPIKTDCVDSDLILSNSLSQISHKEESLFSTTIKVQKTKNSLKTSCQLLQSSRQELMVSENIKKPLNQNSSIKMMKIKLHPTLKQKNILNLWFGVYRRFYNESKIKSEETKTYSFRKLRNSLRVNSKYIVPAKWDTELIPPRIITGSIKDYCSSFQTGMSLFKNKQINHFEIHRKRKKQKTQTLSLEKSCFGKGNVLFPNLKLPKETKDIRDEGITNGLKLSGSYKIKKKKIELENIPIEHDCRISYQNEKFYLLIPFEKKEKETIPKYDIISLDSGIRTFQTGYCPEGHTVEIGKNPLDKLRRQLERIDILNRVWTEVLNRKGKMRKQRHIYEKMSNRVDDLHWKTIKFLTEGYKTIVISDFKTKSLLKRKELGRTSKRILGILSHFKFVQRLIEKCKSKGNELHITDESFTSKTCGKCGRINQFLGSSKDFVCPFCDYESDRDINAGRNILLKFLQS